MGRFKDGGKTVGRFYSLGIIGQENRPSVSEWCDSLTNITIPKGVNILNTSFQGCRGLTDITIHEGVHTISDNAFSGCGSLENVYYEGSRKEWNEVVIGDGNEYLTNATVHFAKEDDIAIETISLNKSTLDMYIGDTENLVATISPTNATNQNKIWQSSDTNVADVSQEGVITAVSTGSAVITVTTEDGVHTASCTVTVVEPIDTGIDANDINWYFYELGLFKFVGSGSMANYANTSTIPWYGEKTNITEIEIGEGITHIGNRSF